MLYLASASPRRRDLLKLAGFQFTVEPAEIDEVMYQDDPACLVQNLALKKARAVAKLHPDDVVLAADTVVALDNHILGKPQDKEQAQKMLRMLSNRVHQVYTGYCILKQSRCEIGVSCTSVEFYPLSNEDILQQANPLTKPADTVSKAWVPYWCVKLTGISTMWSVYPLRKSAACSAPLVLQKLQQNRTMKKRVQRCRTFAETVPMF